MSEWISVEDRLPEDRNLHCVYVRESYVSVAVYDKYDGWIRQHDACEYRDIERYELEGVTHWQPLPDPPE